MEFTVLSVLELHPQSPTAAMLKLGIVVVVVCAYTISKLFIKTRDEEKIVMMVMVMMMVPYPYVKL
jgi:ABC-type maltose transport system permease subunit